MPLYRILFLSQAISILFPLLGLFLMVSSVPCIVSTSSSSFVLVSVFHVRDSPTVSDSLGCPFLLKNEVLAWHWILCLDRQLKFVK